MADVARGERIRDLRIARKLTQPAAVERICEIGGRKPDGSPYLSLRGYQRYEEGGGIPWEKARVLARVLDTTEDYILRGDGERRQPRPARSIDTELAERLASIEDRLDAAEPVAVDRLDGELANRITAIEETLAGIEKALERLVSEREGIAAVLKQQTEMLAKIEAATVRRDEVNQASREVLRRLEELQAGAPPAREEPRTSAT